MGLPVQIQVTETLNTEQCCNCGVWFAMPSDVQRRRREDGEWFYCPHGHRQHYSKTDMQKAREALEAEQARHKATLARLNEAEAERLRTEGDNLKLIRKLNRVQRGVCPHCNRTFQNLAKHMCSKHEKAA